MVMSALYSVLQIRWQHSSNICSSFAFVQYMRSCFSSLLITPSKKEEDSNSSRRSYPSDESESLVADCLTGIRQIISSSPAVAVNTKFISSTMLDGLINMLMSFRIDDRNSAVFLRLVCLCTVSLLLSVAFTMLWEDSNSGRV